MMIPNPAHEALRAPVFPSAHNLGAIALSDQHCQFTVWAPLAERVTVRLLSPKGAAGDTVSERIAPLDRDELGYHTACLPDVPPGTRYMFRLDETKERPDPASRAQPDGVHGFSEVIDPHFDWQDTDWRGLPLAQYIIYELHVGTFTAEGTFDAIIPHLPMLTELGVTAIELMPIGQFPGVRNWGYDGTYIFAAQHSYGGVQGLKRLVNACHQHGIAVVLDVVYNHLGPEGNYLWDYGPYFTERYHTPWGAAVNFDGPHSDDVRRYFLENVLYWVDECHIDALRLDAVHAIMDFSARPFLAEVAEAVGYVEQRTGREIVTIAESDMNNSRLIRPPHEGGYGLDAQWCDDLHHAIYTLLTGENMGYYSEYGTLEQLERSYQNGYIFDGIYSPHRQRRHGNSSAGVPGQRFLVCIQNHDQVGNRMLGDRLGENVSFAQLKLAAAAYLLSPFMPMLFMGEEYAETAPFQYFVSHTDAQLAQAVSEGRRAEFAAFEWQGEVPDPMSPETFERSKLNHDLRAGGPHAVLFGFYQELIRLRKTLPALAQLSREHLETFCFPEQRVLVVRRWTDAGQEVLLTLHFGSDVVGVDIPLTIDGWQPVLDTGAVQWQPTPGAAAQVTLEPDAAGDGMTLRLPGQGFAVFGRNV